MSDDLINSNAITNEISAHVDGSPDKNDEDLSPSKITQARALAAAKASRKQVEQDAQMLANRIALLRGEESKTWKKIDETHKRIKEVLSTKRVADDKAYRRAQFEYERANDNMKKIELVKDQKIRDTKGGSSIKTAIFEQKKDEARQMKMRRMEAQKFKEEMMNKANMENRIKSQMVKQMKSEAKVRTEMIQKHNEARQISNYEKKMQDEERSRETRELEVAQMEKLEEELIRKLQETQVMQKMTYEKLETAINTKPGEADDKLRVILTEEKRLNRNRTKTVDSQKGPPTNINVKRMPNPVVPQKKNYKQPGPNGPNRMNLSDMAISNK